MVRSQNRPCVLGSADGLPVLHSSEPFGPVEAELYGINRWIDVIVYHAGSRSQPQIVLHFLLRQYRVAGRGLSLARRDPR